MFRSGKYAAILALMLVNDASCFTGPALAPGLAKGSVIFPLKICDRNSPRETFLVSSACHCAPMLYKLYGTHSPLIICPQRILDVFRRCLSTRSFSCAAQLPSLKRTSAGHSSVSAHRMALLPAIPVIMTKIASLSPGMAAGPFIAAAAVPTTLGFWKSEYGVRLFPLVHPAVFNSPRSRSKSYCVCLHPRQCIVEEWTPQIQNHTHTCICT
jgi:hypothetical protein